LASELEGLIGDSTRMRYPDRMQYPDIPHSVYTNTMASKAVELADQIIQEVKSKFIN
jgi:sacsin